MTDETTTRGNGDAAGTSGDAPGGRPEHDGDLGTPPLPKVDLPPINRSPADRSTAGYLAGTPGLDLEGTTVEGLGDTAAEGGATAAAGATGAGGATGARDEADLSDEPEFSDENDAAAADAARAEAKRRSGRLGAMWTGIVVGVAMVAMFVWMAVNGMFG